MNVVMPQLGETVSEGTIAAWHKKVGDSVEKGEMLLDVETDKVATEIEAPVTGLLSSIEVEEGETVDVGTLLAVIAVEGEVVPEEVAATEASAVEATDTVVMTGLPEKSAGNRLSPAVRRLLKEHKIDAGDVHGTGRDGRITREDVLSHVAGAAGNATGTEAGDGARRIPFDRVRKVTAAHMVRSKSTSPHVLQTIDVDFSAVDRVRLARRDQWRSEYGYSLSYLPFVARALSIAIAEYPRLNGSVEGDALVLHKNVNLAIAVDLDFEGLVAPVVNNVADLPVSQLAQNFRDLINRAKAGELKPDDLRGGTYTLSNPGPYGTLFTSAIINQPQVAILSMDAVKKRPVVIETDAGDSIEIRPVGILAHSFDHRAIDGAYSAAFLNTLKTVIETRDWAIEF